MAVTGWLIAGAATPAWLLPPLLILHGMADDKLQTLYTQIGEAVKQQAYQDNLKLTHGKVVMLKPQDFKKQLEAEVTRFKKELPELGIKGD